MNEQSTQLSFRRAEVRDTAAVQEVYRAIIAHLAATVDYAHWHSENHPTPEEVRVWVAAGELYLALEDEVIAGVTALNHESPSAYAEAAWALEATPDQVLVVHALGVSPSHLRQGVARFLVDSSLDVARSMGCHAVRLDTYVENTPARALYSNFGFTDLGVHALQYEGTDLTQFHLFEYVLEP